MSDNVFKALKEQSSKIRVDGELVEKTDEAWTVRLGSRVLRINRKDATEIEAVNDTADAISLLVAVDAQIVESILIEAGSVHARGQIIDSGPDPRVIVDAGRSRRVLIDWGPRECSVCLDCTECSVCVECPTERSREFRGNRPVGFFRRFRSSRSDDY